jgi:DNA-binding NtrC family response regulator
MQREFYLGVPLLIASPAMRRLLERVRRVAEGDAPVLITGEGGTGKSLLARAVHHCSPRRSRPWLEVDCELLTRGVFELAREGTLFLDEIGALKNQVLHDLTRSLEQYRCRLVAATRGEPRLDWVRVHVPPLRERGDDILPLAEFFLRQANPDARLSPDSCRALRAYHWPGNVRELRDVITTAAVVNPGSWLRAGDMAVGTAA